MQRPLLLFAPGAGAPSTHPWIQRWRHFLQTVGDVYPFDYSYMVERRWRPDRLPQLTAAHRAALQHARELHSGPAVLIGKSMGDISHAFERRGFVPPQIRYKSYPGLARGTILSQSPLAGYRLNPRAAVIFEVSQGS